MPDIEAVDLADCINESPSLKGMVSIIVTAYGERGDVSKLKQAGFLGFLTKPIRKQDLYDMVSVVLSPDCKGKPLEERIFTTRYILEEIRQQHRQSNEEDLFAAEEVQGQEQAASRHILLVEDNLMNQKVVSKMLEKQGYEITIANHGEEAVQMFRQEQFDLILMDVQMPVMNGIDATRSIRGSEGDGSHVPIIACTANVMKGDRENCIEAGMDGYISKPIKRQDLLEVIEKFTV